MKGLKFNGKLDWDKLVEVVQFAFDTEYPENAPHEKSGIENIFKGEWILLVHFYNVSAHYLNDLNKSKIYDIIDT